MAMGKEYFNCLYNNFIKKNKVTKEDNKILQLQYSLRSIEIFLPWFIGTIFIIDQNMNCNLSWVNTTNEHIKIINPKNIVSKKIIDKYSREIIEMYLDKIPLISERFIYLNTNHYFKNYIHPRFFFNKEYFPKYNFVSSFDEMPIILQNKNESFFKTYEKIKEIFGNNYINNRRFLLDSPISLYRDLFEPVRKLYLSEISFSSLKNFDLLPMYLISTYNIYGTSQIYFPKYVAGFGEIRNFPPPQINQSNRISYYGFDISSEIILKKSILNINLSRDMNDTLFKIKLSKTLFFNIENKENYEKSELDLMIKLLKSLYTYKSFYEI